MGGRRIAGNQREIGMSSYELFDLLDSLGGTAEVVAARLLAEGCRGHRESRCSCPVATFVARHLDADGGDFFVEVSRTVAKLSRTSPRRSSFEAALPPAVAAFVGRFDAGEFPALLTG